MLRSFGTVAVILAGLSLSAAPAVLAEETLGLADLERLEKDAENQNLDFKETYQGQSFIATMPFRSQSKTASGLSVFFGRGSDWQEVVCLRIVDPSTVEMVQQWEPGARVEISGTINDYLVGLNLLDCELSLQL